MHFVIVILALLKFVTVFYNHIYSATILSSLLFSWLCLNNACYTFIIKQGTCTLLGIRTLYIYFKC